jgi:hypothetical protein
MQPKSVMLSIAYAIMVLLVFCGVLYSLGALFTAIREGGLEMAIVVFFLMVVPSLFLGFLVAQGLLARIRARGEKLPRRESVPTVPPRRRESMKDRIAEVGTRFKDQQFKDYLPWVVLTSGAIAGSCMFVFDLFGMDRTMNLTVSILIAVFCAVFLFSRKLGF